MDDAIHNYDSTGNLSVADPETNLASDSTPIWLSHVGDIELSDQHQNFNIFKMLDGDSKIAHFRRFTQDSNSRLDIFDISGAQATALAPLPSHGDKFAHH